MAAYITPASAASAAPMMKVAEITVSGLTPISPIVAIMGAVTLASMLFIEWLVVRTKWGRGMRALRENREATMLMGVNIDRIVALTFFVGSSLAGIGGVLVALYYTQTDFLLGWYLGLKAFAAAVLGGIGNVRGAVLGGLLLGIIESLGAGYIGDLTGGFLGSHYQDVFAFVVLIAVLVFRPTGLLGERVAERA